MSYMGGSLDETESKLAAIAAAPNSYPELYVVDLTASNPQPKKLTDFAAQYTRYNPASREVVRWKSRDGAEIEGILTKPADFDPSKKYPLLVVIHGGPTGIDTPVRRADGTYPIERLVAKGAVVLQPNYRGSAGYGEKFRSLNVRNLGVGDMWDVMSGVDYLISRGFVDETRMGSMGWSQGGYISAFLTTNTTRFKAISVGAGISDWMTYYVNTDITPFTRQYLHATPWDDPEIYAKTSPITNIKQARTPTLIQHGENDKRVPIPNGYQLYQGLKDVGVEARFVIYKGFGHGITKPKQLRHVQEDNERWFLRHIWGEEMKEPVAEEKKPESK
jgi:dipeptidyl aminopeptidase/acylaminoacyl peptidase